MRLIAPHNVCSLDHPCVHTWAAWTGSPVGLALILSGVIVHVPRLDGGRLSRLRLRRQKIFASVNSKAMLTWQRPHGVAPRPGRGLCS